MHASLEFNLLDRVHAMLCEKTGKQSYKGVYEAEVYKQWSVALLEVVAELHLTNTRYIVNVY